MTTKGDNNLEFLFEYGLFLAKAVTVVVACLAVVGFVAAVAMKKKQARGDMEVEDLSADFHQLKEQVEAQLLPETERKKWHKERKKQKKAQKQPDGTAYVIDFKGSIDAREVEQLRQEVSALLLVADPAKDEVIIRLESPGGWCMVTGWQPASLAAFVMAAFR